MKEKHLKCLVRPEKKDKNYIYIRKSLNIRKVKICEMHSTFLFVFSLFLFLKFSQLLCSFI